VSIDPPRLSAEDGRVVFEINFNLLRRDTVAKTFKDSKAARDAQQDRLQRERKQNKARGRNTEQTLWKRMCGEELLSVA
jgi:hypothetical protein